MLTREILENLDWSVGNDGEAYWVEAAADSTFTREAATLQAAAPALALACLEARPLLADLAEHPYAPSEVAAAAQGLLARIEAALAAAGVAPGPEGGA